MATSHQAAVCLVRVSTPITSQGTPIHQMNMVYYKVQDRPKDSLCHCSVCVKVPNAIYVYSEYPKKNGPRTGRMLPPGIDPRTVRIRGTTCFFFLKDCELFLWFSGAKHFVFRELSFQCSLMRYDLSQEHHTKAGSEILTAFPRLCLLFKGLSSSKFRVFHFLKN